ncbi:MAG: anchored repeat-type ABC transporter permease subunit, partial [Acidobacteria bacterium]|nr:anchored repeat-type ABC transporter permease subunit [Acidobacteriota bacterium]
TIVSALGVYLSLALDLPTGATIVCTFGAALLLMAAVHALFFSVRPCTFSRRQAMDGTGAKVG